MAYYNKQDILDYVSENMKEIELKGLKPLNPEAQVIQQLEGEEDMVGFFWISYDDSSGEGEKVKMEGRAYYRVNHDIYTDDRFAIDLYQAMKEGINVTDVIKRREQEKELAKQGIISVDTLEEKVKENIKKDGD